MEKLQNSLACISAEEPSPHILQRTTLRRALHGKNASGAELSLSALTFRALAEGVTSARLRAALDDETDPREAVIEAIVQLNRRYGVSDAERAAGANGIWTARGPGEAAAPSPPVAFDVAALEEELKKLQLGGLWQRATNAGVAAKEVAAALDLPERQRLRKLSALVSTEEQARASAVAARSRTSAKRRSTAHELVWGDSEDEEDDLLEVGFPRVAVDGPPDDLHIGLPVRIRDVEASLSAEQRARVGHEGKIVGINGDDDVRVQFRRQTEWAYWRILAKCIVRENHDEDSTAIGYHHPGKFARKKRGRRSTHHLVDPDFVYTEPGDEEHLKKQDGYVVVVQEHTDQDDTLWVLTKTAPNCAARGGWTRAKASGRDVPAGALACCAGGPCDPEDGGRWMLERVQDIADKSKQINKMNVTGCSVPGVDGSYLRRYAAHCQEHYVNEHGRHMYHVHERKVWQVGTRLFGSSFDNLIIREEGTRLAGRHDWAHSNGESGEEVGGSLVVTVVRTPDYRM